MLFHFGACTPHYIFTTLFFYASVRGRYLQVRPDEYRYINGVFYDCNMGQQCQMQKMGIVEVETCEAPHNEEDAPVGSLLRRFP